MLFKPKNKGKSVTLFFISGPVPTEQEKIDATKLNARLRNAESYSDEDAIEEAQFLAGAVPAGLIERMRSAKMVVELTQASDVPVAEVAPEAAELPVVTSEPSPQSEAPAAPVEAPPTPAPVESVTFVKPKGNKRGKK